MLLKKEKTRDPNHSHSKNTGGRRSQGGGKRKSVSSSQGQDAHAKGEHSSSKSYLKQTIYYCCDKTRHCSRYCVLKDTMKRMKEIPRDEIQETKKESPNIKSTTLRNARLRGGAIKTPPLKMALLTPKIYLNST